jgi:hypothetical protein
MNFKKGKRQQINVFLTKKVEKTGNNIKRIKYLAYKSKGINISTAGKHTVLCKLVVTLHALLKKFPVEIRPV